MTLESSLFASKLSCNAPALPKLAALICHIGEIVLHTRR